MALEVTRQEFDNLAERVAALEQKEQDRREVEEATRLLYAWPFEPIRERIARQSADGRSPEQHGIDVPQVRSA